MDTSAGSSIWTSNHDGRLEQYVLPVRKIKEKRSVSKSSVLGNSDKSYSSCDRSFESVSDVGGSIASSWGSCLVQTFNMIGYVVVHVIVCTIEQKYFISSTPLASISETKAFWQLSHFNLPSFAGFFFLYLPVPILLNMLCCMSYLSFLPLYINYIIFNNKSNRKKNISKSTNPNKIRHIFETVGYN